MEIKNPQDYVFGIIFRMEEPEVKEIVETYLRRHLPLHLYDKLEWSIGADEDNNRAYIYFDEDVFNDNEMQELFEVFSEFDGSSDYDILPNILGEYMRISNLSIEVTYYEWANAGKGMIYIEVAENNTVLYNKLEPWGFNDAN